MEKGFNPNIKYECDFKEPTHINVSEVLFQTTFEQAAIGITHVVPDGDFVKINQK